MQNCEDFAENNDIARSCVQFWLKHNMIVCGHDKKKTFAKV